MNTPRVESTTPCFAVADISQTTRWYEENLGFEGDPFPPNEPYVFAILRRDDVEIMLQRLENYQKPDIYGLRSGGVWNVYIRMRGVKQLYDEVREKVEILQPLRKQPYGQWEFEVKDPNGYVLVFSEFIRAD
jgi:uncharacterized glyoxalase superfamily protein PhnB